ncbi:uncharacterized protein LOC108460184 isoform X2 [Gossypium arboreum]|uniref:ATPase AAA-type core domain-containing protein n=1 Tax=Gossypium arboreum TaxID=29729 RepID=A0ABR0QJD2_GOSAR|nr:uncharacterized protein LOC108460184 isoform X2 [Gossypium arboreum]KAK5839119.1 hypothetical protein PVK06_007881 [Gossypium arboreum]
MQLGLQVNKLSVIFIDEIDALATRRNKEIVKSQSLPAQGSEKLQFSTPFPQNGWEQLKHAFGNNTCPIGEVQNTT